MRLRNFALFSVATLALMIQAEPIHATVHIITTVGLAYTPLGTVVVPGDTVRWDVNFLSHATEAEPSSPKFWSFTSGTTGQIIFTAADTGPIFPYICIPHVSFGMVDTIFMDSDSDGVRNLNDNCDFTAGLDQTDTDNDGVGDICDACPTIPNPCPCCNVAGDADDGGDVNIGDALTIIDFIFGGPNPDPPCLDEADADGGGDVNIGDALTIIDFIFGGPNPDPICGP